MKECQVLVGGDCGLCNHMNSNGCEYENNCVVCGCVVEVGEDVCDGCDVALEKADEHSMSFDCSAFKFPIGFGSFIGSPPFWKELFFDSDTPVPSILILLLKM
jgi:hypothetical protein